MDDCPAVCSGGVAGDAGACKASARFGSSAIPDEPAEGPARLDFPSGDAASNADAAGSFFCGAAPTGATSPGSTGRAASSGRAGANSGGTGGSEVGGAEVSATFDCASSSGADGLRTHHKPPPTSKNTLAAAPNAQASERTFHRQGIHPVDHWPVPPAAGMDFVAATAGGETVRRPARARISPADGHPLGSGTSQCVPSNHLRAVRSSSNTSRAATECASNSATSR